MMASKLMCFYFFLPSTANALLQTVPPDLTRIRQNPTPSSTTSLHSFFNENQKPSSQKSKFGVNGSEDLFTSRNTLKDEALMQAQSAVSSLESALESAVTSLENMQQQLQLQVVQLQDELEASKQELSNTQSELQLTKTELQKAQDELIRSQKINMQLELALEQSQNAAKRADQLESYVTTLKDNSNTASTPPVPMKKETTDPWQLFATSQKVIPVLNDWIAIRGTNDGEIQISGKVTNHPTIPDGDAIVTSPLIDASKAVEKKIVTTLSGSKYRLATPMNMPSSDAASLTITSPEKKKSSQPLIKARSSISIPDLTGSTVGNG
jgi:multidrug efflux pump subunit AcrA (membrane-fusion protein)